MKYRFFLFSLLMLGSMMSASAQVRCIDDPDVSLDMDIEAKSNAAILKLSTFSRTHQMPTDSYVVLVFMDDSTLKLVGRSRSSNDGFESDGGHGFADRFICRTVLNLSPSQVEKFKDGIKSIQIRMLPRSYFREWEKDEIGQPLYQRYLLSKENVMFKKKETQR